MNRETRSRQEQPSDIEQHARQIQHAPRPASGDAYVAHITEMQPRTPGKDSEDERDRLWEQIVTLAEHARVTQGQIADRIGMSLTGYHQLRKRGRHGTQIVRLRRYAETLEGWSESIDREKAEDERAQQRRRDYARIYRWRASHPDAVSDAKRVYYASHRESILAQQREHRERSASTREHVISAEEPNDQSSKKPVLPEDVNR